LDALYKRIEALTAAVERIAAHQPLVDLQTAADHLDVSTRTLRRLVERGEVPFRRIGRVLRFNLALLAPWPHPRAVRHTLASNKLGDASLAAQRGQLRIGEGLIP
jgi:excisionase family DNA binding protein